MKKIAAFAIMASFLLFNGALHAQADKSKRPSPPDSVTQTLTSGTTVTIKYSQPALKGRTIGKDLEPMTGKVWRMGANEATVFELNRDSKIEGKTLSEGRYSMFGIMNADGTFTIIFNKAADIWGTMYDQNKDKDALRVTVRPRVNDTSLERLTYTIEKTGRVALQWGTMVISFKVE